jgi:uncharacterized coiled-coil protein SlyX
MNTAMAEQQKDIQDTVHHLDRSFVQLDKRVSVLEERSQSQARSIQHIHEDVRANNQLVTDLSKKIDRNREEDQQTQLKSQRWVIATLTGVVVSIMLLILEAAL